jgi:hypothetical protein
MEVLFDIQPEPLAERMAHVERSGANLHRGRAAAGLSVDRHRRGVERAAVRLIR